MATESQVQQQAQQQAYEVPGSQMRWRAAQLRAQGFDFEPRYTGNNTYIFFVQQPPGVDPFAYQPPPRPRQHWPRWDSAHLARWGIVLAVVAIMLGALYMAVGSAADEGAPATTQEAQEDGGPFAWLAELRPPWQEDAAPAAQPDPAPFRWPWDAAADTLADAVGDVQATVTMVAGSIVGILVLMISLVLTRKWWGGR